MPFFYILFRAGAAQHPHTQWVISNSSLSQAGYYSILPVRGFALI